MSERTTPEMREPWLRLLESMGAEIVVCLDSIFGYYPNGTHICVRHNHDGPDGQIPVVLMDSQTMVWIESVYVPVDKVRSTIIKLTKIGISP